MVICSPNKYLLRENMKNRLHFLTIFTDFVVRNIYFKEIVELTNETTFQITVIKCKVATRTHTYLLVCIVVYTSSHIIAFNSTVIKCSEEAKNNAISKHATAKSRPKGQSTGTAN